MENSEGTTPKPKTILEEANELIHGERLKHYGHPKVNFKRIADAWSAYKGIEITEIDVAIMMILLKGMRMTEGYHRDSAMDICGYAALISVLADDDAL